MKCLSRGGGGGGGGGGVRRQNRSLSRWVGQNKSLSRRREGGGGGGLRYSISLSRGAFLGGGGGGGIHSQDCWNIFAFNKGMDE